MGKKAIDARIPSLIRNGVQEKERSFFFIVGDKARNQLPNLHYLMMSADLKMNKSVLWAYKKKLLGFTSHRQKRETKIVKQCLYVWLDIFVLIDIDIYSQDIQALYICYCQ